MKRLLPLYLLIFIFIAGNIYVLYALSKMQKNLQVVQASANKLNLALSRVMTYSADSKKILEKDFTKAKRIFSHLSIVPIQNLSLVPIGKGKAKIYEFDLNPNMNGAKVISIGSYPSNWAKDSVIPYPWPAKGKGKSYTFAKNLAGVATYIKKHGMDDKAQAATNYLLAILEKNTVKHGGGLYFGEFDTHNVYGIKFEPVWYSAFSNAGAIHGLLSLYEATKDEKYLKLAHDYVAPLITDTDNFSVTIIDPTQYLWFEEVAHPKGEPFHIMNGHVFALFSVYRYYQISQDPSLIPVIKAGITTMRRYLLDYRIPGEIMSYSLYSQWETRDYGPQRAIHFANSLYELTGDPYFLNVKVAFQTDMPM